MSIRSEEKPSADGLSPGAARALKQSVATAVHATTDLDGGTFASRQDDAAYRRYRPREFCIGRAFDAIEHYGWTPEYPILLQAVG